MAKQLYVTGKHLILSELEKRKLLQVVEKYFVFSHKWIRKLRNFLVLIV